ncbi:prolyl oligopeptidase family serine peptidase [Sphingosinicella sp.]|uniref:S9 family peptidase n=1 Tax=Sphingosinicella sp. TaxID=1917971 RepID=UPI0018349DB6|nr:prolyl oligopeptidase family serine peptidase [Sphingosinicella sp.]MBA4760070.1 S9 family peptidase [Sphingosinicella sp.]
MRIWKGIVATVVWTVFMRLPVSASAQQSDVAQALSFAQASQLAANGAGEIVWTVEQEGMRSVWRASAPDFAATRVAEFEGDDGYQISSLSISARGDVIAFARNSDPLGASEPVNAASRALGAAEEIWVSTQRGATRQVAHGTKPVLSPDGTRLIFKRGRSLLSLDLTRRGAEPRLLISMRGDAGGARFSPSGENIAFVQRHRAVSYLGVYNFASGAVHWMAPNLARDALPVWSPDGRRVAFIRIAGRRFDDDYPLVLSPWPFSIWIADVATGQGRELWASPGDAGGFAQEIGLPLAWADDNNLVFQSEHDGWLRAYRLNVSNGAVSPLTPGSCEVEHASIDRMHGQLLTSNNCGDIDRRHVWTSDIASGQWRQLTSGERTDLNPVSAGGEQIAFIGGDFQTPLSVSVIARAGGEIRRLAPFDQVPTYMAEAFQPPRMVRFTAADGQPVHGYVFTPQNVPAGTHPPALIFVHGGPHRQMLPGWHELKYYSNAYALSQLAARRGFIALVVNYRSGTGYGAAFRNAPRQGPQGGSEHADMLAAADYLVREAGADRARIGIWGGSHGGVVTAYALAHNSDVFAAGADIHGVHDWPRFGFEQYGLESEAFPQSFIDTLRRSSAIDAIDGWRSPVLIITGDDDEAVDVDQSTDLAARLRERGVPVETMLLPNEGHDWRLHRTSVRVGEAILDFFESRLGSSSVQSE